MAVYNLYGFKAIHNTTSGSGGDMFTPIYVENFEGAAYFPSATGAINQIHGGGWENCNTEVDAGGSPSPTLNATYDYGWTLTRVDSPVQSGTRAGKFEIRFGQPTVGTLARIRSEVTIFKPVDDSWVPDVYDFWYSFGVYFPTSGYGDDPADEESINQWYEDGDARDTRLIGRNGRLYLEVQHPTTGGVRNRFDMMGAVNASPVTSSGTASTTFVPITKDTWYNFVFHFIHAEDSSGLIEVWRDGVKIQTLNGKNMHQPIVPKWKVGLYKGNYDSSVQPNRIVYFDNIKWGVGE